MKSQNQNDDEPESSVASILIFLAQAVAVTLMIGAFSIFVMKEAPAKDYYLEDVAQLRVAPMVIKVTGYDKTGTGFYLKVGSKVITITNKHVCTMMGPTVKDKLFVNGTQQKVISVSSTNDDLCALESDSKLGLKLAEVGVAPLTKVHSVGYPRGMFKMIRLHRVLLTSVSETPIGGLANIMKLSDTIVGGESGSPVTNKYGDVVGVILGYDENPFQHGLAVPHQQLVRFIEVDLKGKI